MHGQNHIHFDFTSILLSLTSQEGTACCVCVCVCVLPAEWRQVDLFSCEVQQAGVVAGVAVVMMMAKPMPGCQ